LLPELFAALIAFGPGQAAHEQDVVVFAAASLTNALDEAAKLFERQGGAHAKNILRGESGAGQADRKRRAG
jgi:ABC-type molybdate transport system substrate-binding protein